MPPGRLRYAVCLHRQAVQRERVYADHSSRWADKTLRGLQEFLLADKKRVSAVPVDTAPTQLRRVSLPNPIEYAETKASLDPRLAETHEAKRRAARSSAAAEAEAAGAGSEVAARAKARALRTGRGERTGSGWSPSGVQVQAGAVE